MNTNNMSVYKYGSRTTKNDSTELFSIEKRTFFGWKKVFKVIDSRKSMMDNVDKLKSKGHLVLHMN